MVDQRCGQFYIHIAGFRQLASDLNPLIMPAISAYLRVLVFVILSLPHDLAIH